ncbi:MAG: HEAT repeat domain-containing protein [Sedimentisphaeraceae bacterium JB056]
MKVMGNPKWMVCVMFLIFNQWDLVFSTEQPHCLLSGQSLPVETIIQSITESSGGIELQESFQLLALRKNEALPYIQKKLKTGSVWEKISLIKFIQYSSWPEVSTELIAIAADTKEHWLSRQGALYALGEIGNANVGAEILSILCDSNCPQSIQLVAISALARIGYEEASPVIRGFVENENPRIRLFACRALAEFGEPVNIQFLLTSLNHQDYIVRQDACGALAVLEGEDITLALSSMATNDFNESVRSVAQISLLKRKIRNQTQLDKLSILKKALEKAEHRTIPWIIKTTLKECGSEGKRHVKQVSGRDDEIGERASAFLIAQNCSPMVSLDDNVMSTNDVKIIARHASTPTHQTLMEYSINKAGSLLPPLGFTGTQKIKMKEGSADEDSSSRPLDHAYRPIDGGSFPFGTTALKESQARWGSMVDAFEENGDGWHYLGRVSHILQDMSSPLHVFAVQHLTFGCKFESYWETSDSKLRDVLNSIGGPLHSSSPLPEESMAKLDSFTQERLKYRFATSCPEKNNDDVRGWIDVLAWITYFRSTFWGEVKFGSSSRGSATSFYTTGTDFIDGYVGSKINILHTMFNGNIKYIDGWTDNYYEITDRKGYVFRWMSWSDIDDWGSCGRNWANGKQDSSIRVGGSDDDDNGVRITGRFWFDTRELGKDSSGSYNRKCYPNKYPNGDPMVDDLHLYYGKYGYPLAVRYNAGLLGLANRRITVKTNCGTAYFSLGRKDNLGNGQDFTTGTNGSDFYFVAKSSVTIEAPYENSSKYLFNRWLKNGKLYSMNKNITINTAYNWIPQGGEVYIAEYSIPTLTRIEVSGSSSVQENSFAQYTCKAFYSNGTSAIINPQWTDNSIYASISSAGTLTTLSVNSDKNVTITASYTSGGVTKTDTHALIITDIPVTLEYISIAGSSSVNEGASATYTCKATYSDSTTLTVIPTWSIISGIAYASINSNGKLTAGSDTYDQEVVVQAVYGGKTDTYTVTINVDNTPYYVVTFATGDHGEIISGQTVQQIEEGSSATAPTILEDSGWEFIGWDTVFDNVTSDLTVTALYTEKDSKPDWQSPQGLLNSMTVYAQIYSSGNQIGTDIGSLLSVWDSSGNIAGVAEVVDGVNGKLFILSVYNDNTIEDGMVLKLYDGADGEIYEVGGSFSFESGTSVGSLSNPEGFSLSGEDISYLQISLVSGWNWISFSVLPDEATLGNVFAELESIADQDKILSANGLNATYYQGQWYGTLQLLEPGLMYKLKTANSDILTVSGQPVDPATQIHLVAGWNWLGYTLCENAAFSTVMDNFPANNNNYITNQFGKNLTYWDGQWYGMMSEMKPGLGYMMKVSQECTLSFSEVQQ